MNLKKHSKKPILAAMALLVIFSNYQCKECKDTTKSYEEQEAYTDTEKKDIELEYELPEKMMHYNREEGAVLLGDNPKLIMNCEVTNKSEEGGYFEFYANFASQGDMVSISQKEYISGGTTITINAEKEINPFSFKANLEVTDWGIKAPTVTTEKQVTKYRTITKYRPCNTCNESCN